MRAKALSVVGALSVLLQLLLCLSGAAAQGGAVRLSVHRREMPKNGPVAAHHAQGDGYDEPTGYGYTPPPYHTVPFTVSTTSDYYNPPAESTLVVSSASEAGSQTVQSVASSSIGSIVSTTKPAESVASSSSLNPSGSGSAFSTAAGWNTTRSQTESSLTSTISTTVTVSETISSPLEGTGIGTSTVYSGSGLNQTATGTSIWSVKSSSQWPSHPRSSATGTFYNLTVTLPTSPSSQRTETSTSTTSPVSITITFVSPMFSTLTQESSKSAETTETTASEAWSTITLTESKSSGLATSSSNVTVTLTSTVTSVPTSGGYVSSSSSRSVVVLTKTRSVVMTSQLTETLTRSNSSAIYSSASGHVASTNSSQVYRTSTQNATSSMSTATPVVITVTRGSVVTVLPSSSTQTRTLTNMSAVTHNMTTARSQPGSSSSSSEESVSVTSDWSTVTLDQSKTSVSFPSVSMSLNTSASASSFSSSTSIPFPANSTFTRAGGSTGLSASSDSIWSATETITLGQKTSQLTDSAVSTQAGRSTVFSFPANSTVTYVNGTKQLSTLTRSLTSTIYETAPNTASGPGVSTITATSRLASPGHNTSIIVITLSRSSSLPPFPLPTNSSSVWGTTIETAAAGSRTAASPSSSGYANGTTSGKSMTASASPPYANSSTSSTVVTLWSSTITVTVVPTQANSTTVSGSNARTSTLTRNIPWNTTQVSSGLSTGSIPRVTLSSLSPPYPTMNKTVTSTVTTVKNATVITSSRTGSGTLPPFTVPPNSTVASSISESGFPLPLPFPTNGSTVTVTQSVNATYSPSLPSESQSNGSSTASAAGTSTSNSTSLSAVTPPVSSTSSPSFTSTSTKTIVITRSPASTPPFPTGNVTTSSITATEHGGSSVSIITLTRSETSRVSSANFSTSTGWSNTTSDVSGASETAASSDSVQPSTPVTVTETSSVTLTLHRNSTASAGTSVSAQATHSGTAAITSGPWRNETTTCLSRGHVANSTTSCTSVPSTTCTESQVHAQATSSSVGSTSNCTLSPNRTVSAGSFHPHVPIPVTPVCSSSSTTSICTTLQWANMTAQSTSQRLTATPKTTTFETVTTTDAPPSVASPIYPSASQAAGGLPDDPNFPWGGNSPIHRHGNTSRLGEGSEQEPPSFSPPRRRWDKFVSKMKALWQNDGAAHGEGQD